MEEREERPWELPGEVRRDCEPHRARLLDVLANVSVACGFLSCFLLVPSLIGLPLGIAAYLMARRDLKLMEGGLMDPEGKSRTQNARRLAGAGIAFSIASWAFYLWLHFLYTGRL